MDKKLYRVKVVLYVMADNESDARVAATQAQFDIFECSARRAGKVNDEWEGAIPYNADDERTCAEILVRGGQAASPERRSGKMPAFIEASMQAFDIGIRSVQSGRQN